MSVISLVRARICGRGPAQFTLRRRAPLYVASRAGLPDRQMMWRALRLQGFNIVSTWIDEPEGQASDVGDLWTRVVDEISRARSFVLYAETDDFPLKGALVEIGVALARRLPITICLPDVQVDAVSARPVGSWIDHPLVIRDDDIGRAMVRAELRGDRP